ncbi:MAG: InlB B-repeat-containing protein [Candidatus Fimimonas sp.]
MKTKKSYILIAVFALLALTLCACNPTVSHSGIKVVFMLEGGSYQNGKDAIIQYYNFPEGSRQLIKPLGYDYVTGDYDEEKSGLTYQGYVLDGWYKTKNADGTYSDEWNFDADTVDENGVTLYAKWVDKISYEYEIYDFDTREKISTKTVNEGVSFSDRYVPNRSGYTYLEKYDGEGNVWGSQSPRPTAENPVVPVYVKYVQGDYTVVKTASDLVVAASQSNKSIYLFNDVDLGGAEICFTNFTKEFRGNGHTVSNFKVLYEAGKSGLTPDFDDDSKNSLVISLFVSPDGANIHDVNFQNVSVDVNTTFSSTYKIYVAPLAVSANNTTVSNVTLQGNLTITKLPEAIVADSSLLVIEYTNAFLYSQGSSVSESNFQLTVD